MKKERILVVAPHADDEIIGLGGSLLKWKSQGLTIKIVLVTSFDSHMAHAGTTIPASVRVSEFEAACAYLSTEPPEVFHIQSLDGVPIRDVVAMLDKVCMEFKPDTFIYPEPSYHQDHQITNRACTAALRPTKKNRPLNVLTYEIPTSTWVGSGEAFTPNYYVNVDAEIDRKMEIFEDTYASQFSQDRSKLAIKGIRDHARYRGMECDVEYAEAFRALYLVEP